jgi:hypothetical protein
MRTRDLGAVWLTQGDCVQCALVNCLLLRRRVKVLWFQYEITFGAYCFVWWEKLIVHAILVSIIFLVVYGVSRQVWAIHALCTSLLRQ